MKGIKGILNTDLTKALDNLSIAFYEGKFDDELFEAQAEVSQLWNEANGFDLQVKGENLRLINESRFFELHKDNLSNRGYTITISDLDLPLGTNTITEIKAKGEIITITMDEPFESLANAIYNEDIEDYIKTILDLPELTFVESGMQPTNGKQLKFASHGW